MEQQGKLIVASNCPPVNIIDESSFQYKPGNGGLVKALESIHWHDKPLWLAATYHEAFEVIELSEYQYHPVQITKTIFEKHDDGFASQSLWPLLHYQVEQYNYQPDYWEAYYQFNDLFAQKIVRLCGPDDLIWIHDYQLLLLPWLIKQKKPSLKIGLFLHTPFPSLDVLKINPCYDWLIQGMLANDLIAFQSQTYLNNFHQATQQLEPNQAQDTQAITSKPELKVIPVSIDAEAFDHASQSLNPQQIEALGSDCFRFLSVERLDYSKGLELKLKAYQQFLQTYPEYIGETQLFLVTVPTRTNVPQYQHYKAKIEAAAGTINNNWGTPYWNPVHLMYNFVELNELAALYRTSDALLVTSKADGMNLIGMEYTASQNHQDPGVPIISQFATVSHILNAYPIINPWNSNHVAQKMYEVINMANSERSRIHQQMLTKLKRYTAHDWAIKFINSLREQ